MRQFNQNQPKALEYLLNALNLADLILRRGINLQLAVNLVELWADAQPVETTPNVEQMLNGLLEYATGRLYAEEKGATLLLTGHRFSSGETMGALTASVCTSRAVGIVQVSPNESV